MICKNDLLVTLLTILIFLSFSLPLNSSNSKLDQNSNTGNEFVTFMTTDNADNIYLSGSTNSINFPNTTIIGNISSDLEHAFLAKFTPEGSLVFSILFSSNYFEWINDVKIDNLGNIIITGRNNDQPTNGSLLMGHLSNVTVMKLDQNLN